jgi:hypothetical protein
LTSGSDLLGCTCRVAEELTSKLLADGAAEAPPAQALPSMTRLLQQAEQLLSDMHREEASAVDAMVAIATFFEAADEDGDGLDGGHELGARSLLLPGCDFGADHDPLLGGQAGRPPPVGEMDRGEVGLEEKVAWMQLTQDELTAHDRSSSDGGTAATGSHCAMPPSGLAPLIQPTGCADAAHAMHIRMCKRVNHTVIHSHTSRGAGHMQARKGCRLRACVAAWPRICLTSPTPGCPCPIHGREAPAAPPASCSRSTARQ